MPIATASVLDLGHQDQVDELSPRRGRIDRDRRNEIEVLVSIAVIIVLAGFGAYFYAISTESV